ncbi:MAG: glycosyl hydrolase [Bryobacteraceae bacterium]
MQAISTRFVLVLGLTAISFAQTTDPLLRGFRDPPASAKPRVWWHWMNGNISKEGIKLDLEWMKRTGIGGFQNFDAALTTPQIVEKRLVYMTPEWKDAFRYTATLADQMGLEMAIAGSPGWSETGGPWVPPSDGMKKFVWSETTVEGGRPFSGTLPKPPHATGPFQNISEAGGVAALLGEKLPPPPEYYADSAVVAFRIPAREKYIGDLQPKVTSSAGSIDVALLNDGDFMKTVELPKGPAKEKAWIQFEFAQPQTIRAFTLGVRGIFRFPFGPPPASGEALEASDDGVTFHEVATVPADGAVAHTIAFADVTAKFFRAAFLTKPGFQMPMDIPGFHPPPDSPQHLIAELVLHSGARVNRAEEKAAFATLPDLSGYDTPAAPSDAAVSKADVIDLTSKMRPDGTLDWTPPAGRWTVLRLGYSLLGITNHPASPEATGLEVDKLSRPAVKAYLDHYLDLYKGTVGELMGARGLRFMVTDSYEAGAQNWTGDIMTQFNRRRGYDMHPWLPVLTGRVVDSSTASDRFLWDFRKTLGELIAENHYDQIGEILHQRGMGRYTESHESGRAFIGDGMDVKKKADIPMSAMWTPRPGEMGDNYGYDADIRESASVAHIYGQNIAAAESLTAIGTPWQWSPESLKPTADKELADGLNRFVIHTSVHQPVSDKKPGLGLGPFGQWFTRHETWAEQAKPWATYLARSSYLLQQGKFSADVAYYYGEDSNITALFGNRAPAIPAGYAFDYVSAGALLTRFGVASGRLTTPSGMSYAVLALDSNASRMSLPVLRKIRDLVKAGAAVFGAKPVGTPSLADDQAEFEKIANEVWGSPNAKVFATGSIGDALAAIKVSPDFEYTKPANDTTLLFVHRRLPAGDIYWVNNRHNRAEDLEATFRVTGKTAELWDPETGSSTAASYRIADGRTTVPLRLQPNQAVFVVFRHSSAIPSRTVPAPVETPVATVEGSWDVSFYPGRGAPEKITLDSLINWADSSDAGVKYFSGGATYTKTVDAPSAWLKPGAKLWLDLGAVKNLAEVTVNRKSLGIVWKTPFRVDATTALKPGANVIQVKVTNLWVNRLIGDQQPNAKKYTYTTQPFYPANAPLQPSGLLGPVQVISVENK